MSTAPDLVYTRSKRSTRAKSAHHTEAAGKRELPWQEIYYRDEKPAFERGDTVKVIDKDNVHFNRIGHVSQHLRGTSYSVKFDWSISAFLPFHKSQLAKVKPVEKKKRKRKDKFKCEWGVCDLSKHPDMPKRWAARNQPTGAVIALEAQSQSTRQAAAHAMFLAFMASLERPTYTRWELHQYIEKSMEKRARAA